MAEQQEQKQSIDFSKIRRGLQTIKNVVYEEGDYKRVNPQLGDKDFVLKAINDYNCSEMRDISNFFYRTSGIYNRLCRYMAYLYRYDWLVTPFIQNKKISNEKIYNNFSKVLFFLDEFGVKSFFGDVALKVIKNGCYFGYITENEDDGTVSVQELPIRYCRTTFSYKGRAVVEFDMRYFDHTFRDTTQRMRMVELFPKEFKKGYMLYKEKKLVPMFPGDSPSWYVLDVDKAVKFNINNADFPAFISVIPAIIDLNDAQGLDRQKMKQQILKLIIQKMPIDKNGDLVFDVDEAQELHNNAVMMLGNAIGLDVLTTFADIDVASMSDNKTTTTQDELEKVERTVFNEAGVSQMQFNTDGNLALEKSILNDEASMYNLLLQFESFLNLLIKPFNTKPNQMTFRVQLLTTTIYNYQNMSKLYKEQTQLGYSKMLPQIALGQSQSSILANAYFENDILDLVNLFVPPMMSSTMNAQALDKEKQGQSSESNGKPGRNEKPDDEKSEKTIRNKESEN